MKKSLLILFCLFLIAALLSGCTSSKSTAVKDPAKKAAPDGFNKTGFPIVDKPITLTMFSNRSPANGPYKDMEMFKTYEEKTNIKLKFNDIPQQGFDEKKNLVFGKKDLPDIFFKAKISNTDQVKYGENGVLLPLDGLIQKYAPNIQAIFKAHPEVKQGITAPDGHIYAIPSVMDLLSARTQKLWLNMEMLKGVGVDVPTTTDDLFNVLKAFKDKYPNNIPLLTRAPSDLIYSFAGAWGLTQQMGYFINIDNEKVHIWLADDKYKQELEYLNKLWKNNLIGHKLFEQTPAQYISQMQSGKVGLFINQNTTPFAKVADKYEGIAPFKGPNGDQTYVSQPLARDSGAFALSSTNKNPEASIRWLDFFYSKEGSLYFRYGKEGDTWDYDSNHQPQFHEDVLKAPKGIGSVTPYPGGASPQYVIEETAGDINEPATAAATKKIEPYVQKQVYPEPMFSPDEAKKVSDIIDDINTYANEARGKFINGSLNFDKDWDNYVSKLKQIGIDQLEKYYQSAYDRQFKK